MVGDPGGGTLKNQAGLAWWGGGYGYGLWIWGYGYGLAWWGYG